MSTRSDMEVIVKTLVGKTRRLFFRPKGKHIEHTIRDENDRPIATVTVKKRRRKR